MDSKIKILPFNIMGTQLRVSKFLEIKVLTQFNSLKRSLNKGDLPHSQELAQAPED
jgi:hypothetical protein